MPARRDADRRSAQFFWWAFPDRRRHPDRWRTRGTCIFTATAGRSAFPCLRAAFWRRRLAARAKNNGSEPLVRCPPDRGESVKGGLAPLSQKENQESELAVARFAREEVPIPEPGATGSRVPRPHPLLLRGLRAALAALRKLGAQRRAAWKRGARAPRSCLRLPRASSRSGALPLYTPKNLMAANLFAACVTGGKV